MLLIPRVFITFTNISILLGFYSMCVCTCVCVCARACVCMCASVSLPLSPHTHTHTLHTTNCYPQPNHHQSNVPLAENNLVWQYTKAHYQGTANAPTNKKSKCSNNPYSPQLTGLSCSHLSYIINHCKSHSYFMQLCYRITASVLAFL